jgi:hypothetical protein
MADKVTVRALKKLGKVSAGGDLEVTRQDAKFLIAAGLAQLAASRATVITPIAPPGTDQDAPPAPDQLPAPPTPRRGGTPTRPRPKPKE